MSLQGFTRTRDACFKNRLYRNIAIYILSVSFTERDNNRILDGDITSLKLLSVARCNNIY